MARRDTSPIGAGARQHHLANVVPIHRPRVNPAHPSLQGPTVAMFDQEQAPPDQFVKLTRIEAQLVASLLNVARAHLPSPKACDQAIELLTGTKR